VRRRSDAFRRHERRIDRDAEFADVRPDGLMWVTGGAKLIALSSSAAALVTQDGVRRTYRRSPITSGAMLAWRVVKRSR
jgi:hypothetical protein